MKREPERSEEEGGMTSEDGLGSTREGDLDVLCATVTASCQSQTGVSEAVAQRDGHVEVDRRWISMPDICVDPSSRFAYNWMAVVTMAVLYNWTVIILRVAFEDMRDDDLAWKVFSALDFVSDAIYLLDIVIQSRTAFLLDGCLVKIPVQTVRYYRSKTRSLLDVLAIAPVTTLLSYLTASPGLRVLHLLKYQSVIRFFDKSDSHTNNPNLLRAFKLSLCVGLVIHWIGCFYYILSQYEGLGTNDWVYTNKPEYSDFRRKYLLCMYWSTVTLTTIGERHWPVTDVEYVFTGLTFLIGVFVFAIVVGYVGDVISNMNAARHHFQARMDQIKFYLQYRHVPDHLQNRVKRWAEYTWFRTKAIDEGSMLQLLPERLRTEVAIHVHLQTLKKVRIFEQCEEGLLRELVLKLRPSIYSPGEYICRMGEVGRDMYIIDHGKVEILFQDRNSGEMKQVAVMLPGNYFGEISLLKLDEGQSKRTADVRSIGFSELLCLSKRDLITALTEYPEAKKILETHARERMKQTRREFRQVDEENLRRPSCESSVSRPRRVAARDIFAQAMKQQGFSELLSARASKELIEMREILNELREIKRCLTEKSLRQTHESCQSNISPTSCSSTIDHQTGGDHGSPDVAPHTTGKEPDGVLCGGIPSGVNTTCSVRQSSTLDVPANNPCPTLAVPATSNAPSTRAAASRAEACNDASCGQRSGRPAPDNSVCTSALGSCERQGGRESFNGVCSSPGCHECQQAAEVSALSSRGGGQSVEACVERVSGSETRSESAGPVTVQVAGEPSTPLANSTSRENLGCCASHEQSEQAEEGEGWSCSHHILTRCSCGGHETHHTSDSDCCNEREQTSSVRYSAQLDHKTIIVGERMNQISVQRALENSSILHNREEPCRDPICQQGIHLFSSSLTSSEGDCKSESTLASLGSRYSSERAKRSEEKMEVAWSSENNQKRTNPTKSRDTNPVQKVSKPAIEPGMSWISPRDISLSQRDQSLCSCTIDTNDNWSIENALEETVGSSKSKQHRSREVPSSKERDNMTEIPLAFPEPGENTSVISVPFVRELVWVVNTGNVPDTDDIDASGQKDFQDCTSVRAARISSKDEQLPTRKRDSDDGKAVVSDGLSDNSDEVERLMETKDPKVVLLQHPEEHTCPAIPLHADQEADEISTCPHLVRETRHSQALIARQASQSVTEMTGVFGDPEQYEHNPGQIQGDPEGSGDDLKGSGTDVEGSLEDHVLEVHHRDPGMEEHGGDLDVPENQEDLEEHQQYLGVKGPQEEQLWRRLVDRAMVEAMQQNPDLMESFNACLAATCCDEVDDDAMSDYSDCHDLSDVSTDTDEL